MAPPTPSAPSDDSIAPRHPDPAVAGVTSDHDTDDTDETVVFERSPLDVYRVVVYAGAALVVVLGTRYLRAGTDGFEENLTSFLSVDVQIVRDTLDAALVAGTFLASLAVLVIPLLARRWRVFGYVLSANLLAGISVAVVNAWVGDLDPVSAAEPAGAVALDVSTDVASSTQMIASFVAIAPFVGRRWRRLGLWIVVALTVLRLAVADGQSTHVLLVLTLGAAVGSGVLLVFGRPSTQPSVEGIVHALRASGLEVVDIRRASVDARGSVPWFAELADGTDIFVKVLGTNQRAADLLFRFYRMFRLRNVGDERPFSSLRRTVEHEALVALAARDVGVRTPRLRAVSAVGRDSFLLAYERIDGRSLDQLDAEALSDEVLTGIWEQVAVLRRHRIAHRDLRLANVFLATDTATAETDTDTSEAEPWMIDFGFSEVAADDALLRSDLAQLLASLAVTVGPNRAVAQAAEVLGTDELAGALSRLQPAALSGATQSALKERQGLLEDLREELESVAQVDEPQLEPVTRFTLKQVLTLAGAVTVIYFLAPQLADLAGVFAQIADANWWWLLPMLTTSVITYLAAGASITGSVNQTLPAGPTIATQVASSFAGLTSPAGLGGMTLNVRFLQRQGVETSEATSAVGLNAVSGIVGHSSLALVFLLWAARQPGPVNLPSPGALLAGSAAVALIALVAMAIPATRRLVGQRLLPMLASAGDGLRAVQASPTKLVLLLGGSTLVTFSYGATFYFSAMTLGIHESFATLMTVYLLGAAVATIAPTPGGLGAVEAALIGALIAIGVDTDPAVPAVFLFRIITFWLPVAPGWVSFRWLRRTERL